MAYKSNNIVAIDDNRAGSFANVTVQNNGFLEVNSSDGFQGTVAGYSSGGSPTSTSNRYIDKFPFASDTNSTVSGDIESFGTGTTGHSSSTHGYMAGGTSQTNLSKFAFATDTNATVVGNLRTDTGQRPSGYFAGAGISSPTFGYIAGGGSTAINTVEKFPFAIDSGSSNVGDLLYAPRGGSGSSSTENGYVAGGISGISPPTTIFNDINKFPFASDTNATDVGDLTQARNSAAGQSSVTHGYSSGGQIPAPNTPPVVNTIEKFPFATNTNATDIGDLTIGRGGFNMNAAGQSSTNSGYTTGGAIDFPITTVSNVIDKFPFSSDTNASDVGDLGIAGVQTAGNQD